MLLTSGKNLRYWTLTVDSIGGRQGLVTLNENLRWFPNKQAVGRGIRPHVQAMIRIGGEQGCGASRYAYYRVSRPAVFLGSYPDE
jgi:hypothetical protein